MNNITIPWPDWTIVREIGRGGFGTVYEISRKDQCGSEEKAALKVISIPNEAEAINQFRMDGYDDASISARLKEDARKIQQEYYLQNQMKGHPNIVRVDENMVTAHKDGLGWDIFIRMELLHPMMEILMTKQDFSEKEIIKIGMDICEALKVCHKRDIIHRDIKPDNIFLSDAGIWKLGDFGIARTMEHTTKATKAGTYNYLAPEVYHGEKYGKQVDIYSLGMVLYWLLNKRRRPFLPVDRPPTASEDEQARIKRFRGDPLPVPVHGSERLKRIVLKACAYHPKDRYSSPEEMHMDLQAVESGAYQGNASAAAGKDEYDSFVVLESAYEENGISAGYGNGSDASAGNKTAGAFGYGSAASVGNGSASGSRSSAGEGVSMGNGWEKDGTETIGNPHRPKGGRNKNDFLENTGKTERSVEISKVEKEPEKKVASSSNTVEEGKKTGIIIPIIVAAIVAAFFIFGGESSSSNTDTKTQTASSRKEIPADKVEELSFCKDFYYKYMDEFMDGMDQLNVDYVNDSIADIASKLQDAGWQFMPYNDSDISIMTPYIPYIEEMKWSDYSDDLYLRAVYPLSDDKKKGCEIFIRICPASENVRENRSVTFIGGANPKNAPVFRNESTGKWEEDKNWIAKAPEIQKRAFTGFMPKKFIEQLSTATWEETGLTKKQINSLRDKTRDYGSTGGFLHWETNGWNGSCSFFDINSSKYRFSSLSIKKEIYDENNTHTPYEVEVSTSYDNYINSIQFTFEN